MTVKDKLQKLAAENKDHNPFEKIDEMEKEFNLDETPEEHSSTDTDDKHHATNAISDKEKLELDRIIAEKQALDIRQPK